MSTDVRVRFAPSPTGYLHVGGARTALFDYLFARHCGGAFILRLEDTDRSRLDEQAIDEIYESLRWLGLDWDEGPGVGGPYGPYVQSERTELYQSHIAVLLGSQRAYRCFCSPERLRELRERQEKDKDARVGYDRHCRDISPEQSRRMADEGKPFVVRFAMPEGRTVQFDDVVRGGIEYRTDVLDDTILLKSDGFPTYHLANVVDDHHMRISHVIRGEEWIASTPLHLLMYEAFGWTAPRFAHVPVILSPDGGKLSKRKGAASVMDFQRGGFLPEAMVNFLALLGWSPGDDREKMTRDELIAAFDLDRVNPKAAVFDEQKLEWLNGQYLRDYPLEAVADTVLAAWRERGWIGADATVDDPRLREIIHLTKSRARRVTDIAPSAGYFFEDPREYDPKGAKKHFKGNAAEVLEGLAEVVDGMEVFEAAPIEKAYRAYAEQRGIGAGKVIHPTRLAISGTSMGPGLFEMMAVMGKETVARRLRRAAASLASSPE